jgi:hypothetical protein
MVFRRAGPESQLPAYEKMYRNKEDGFGIICILVSQYLFNTRESHTQYHFALIGLLLGFYMCLKHFFTIKPTRCTNFTNLFCHETLHVSDSSSVHHQEYIHCKLSNGICHTGLYTAVEQDQDGPVRKLCTNLYDMYVPLLRVQ